MNTSGALLHSSAGCSGWKRRWTNLKIAVKCEWCGKPFLRDKGQIRDHVFCCRSHAYAWNANRIAAYNRTQNPMNRAGGVLDSRIRSSMARSGDGEGKAYRKYLGRHLHRQIAEQIIGRPLHVGEVVHHIDGNKLNNDPSNIAILPSQAEHARLHCLRKKGGDAK